MAKTKNTSNNTYHDYIHALSLTTGSELFGGPMEIAGQVSGTGLQARVAPWHSIPPIQSAALAASSKWRYLHCFGSVGDIGGVTMDG